MLKSTIKGLFAASLLSWSAHAEGPALWTFSDEDTVVHLFGSIHLMKEGVDWYVDEVKEAFEASDTLVVEVDTTDINPVEIQQAMATHGLLTDGSTLFQHLSAEDQALFTQVAGEQISAQLQGLQPWFAALQLGLLKLQELGARSDIGVDMVLIEQAKSAGKSIQSLETATGQIEIMASASIEDQAANLSITLEQLPEMEQIFNAMSEGWLNEDLKAIDEIVLQPGRDQAPAFFEKLFIERNKNWIPQILALLDEPGTKFVVVGAGHLIGEDSVVDLLEEQNIILTQD